EHEGVAQWYQEVYDFDWGIGDWHEMDEVNLYWNPNIPTSSSTINVTVYARMLNDTNVDEVELDVRINAGTWSNNTITSNIFESSEFEQTNYYYLISPQADMTNITVVGRIRVGATWHSGVPMVIRVRNSIASPTTTLTTTPTTTTEDPMAGFLAEFGVWLAIAGIGIVCGGGSAVAYKKGMLPGAKKKTRRRRRKK
ncbi:MAG: hypothetical protein KAQ65_12185, partial [Candidatus Thorarchaeota archaeon]|nr:hypothetical protein [Candidatus Thorarchaeota archaeon]